MREVEIAAPAVVYQPAVKAVEYGAFSFDGLFAPFGMHKQVSEKGGGCHVKPMQFALASDSTLISMGCLRTDDLFLDHCFTIGQVIVTDRIGSNNCSLIDGVSK